MNTQSHYIESPDSHDLKMTVAHMVSRIESLDGYVQNQHLYIAMLHGVVRLSAQICKTNNWETFTQLRMEMESALRGVADFETAYRMGG